MTIYIVLFKGRPMAAFSTLELAKRYVGFDSGLTIMALRVDDQPD